MIPGTYRNVTGTMLLIPAITAPVGMKALSLETSSNALHGQYCDFRAILLDCGEGSWQQLLRLASSTFDIKQYSTAARPDRLTDAERFEQLSLSMAARIEAVWISHPHADHFLGVTQLLTERAKYMKYIEGQASSSAVNPIVIIAPPQVLNYIDEYAAVDPFIRLAYIAVSTFWLDPHERARAEYWATKAAESQPISTVDAEEKFDPLESSTATNLPTDLSYPDNADRPAKEYNHDEQYLLPIPTQQAHIDHLAGQHILMKMGITGCTNVRVKHCMQSYAVRLDVSLTHRNQQNELMYSSSQLDNFKELPSISIVFSGDCRPCNSLIALAKDCDVLIHEATFDDEKIEEALNKNHSTISEASSVALQCRAKKTILTHFSQRYPGTPPPPTGVTYPHHTSGIRHPNHIISSDGSSVALQPQDIVTNGHSNALMNAAKPLTVNPYEELCNALVSPLQSTSPSESMTSAPAAPINQDHNSAHGVSRGVSSNNAQSLTLTSAGQTDAHSINLQYYIYHTALAFDFMTFSIQDLFSWIPSVKGLLLHCFPNEDNSELSMAALAEQQQQGDATLSIPVQSVPEMAPIQPINPSITLTEKPFAFLNTEKSLRKRIVSLSTTESPDSFAIQDLEIRDGFCICCSGRPHKPSHMILHSEEQEEMDLLRSETAGLKFRTAKRVKGSAGPSSGLKRRLP